MTYAELETQLYSHTDLETEALKQLPLLKQYMDIVVPERPLSPDEVLFCDTFREGPGWIPLVLDAKGYVSDEAMFEEQEGIFHTRRQPRYAAQPTHRHHYFEILVVYAGKCEQMIDGVRVSMRTGDVCVLSMGTAHQILPLDAGDIVLHLLVKPSAFMNWSNPNPMVQEWFEAQTEGKMVAPWQVIPCAGRERFWSVLRLMLCEYQDHDLLSFSIVGVSFIPLFGELARARAELLGQPLEIRPQDEGLNILEYVRHFYNSCTLESISRQFGYSQSYISLLIKKRAGMNFTQLRRQYRLEHAAAQLRETEHAIAEIAEMCGYRNLSFFYRAFKEKYGVTPQQYREEI